MSGKKTATDPSLRGTKVAPVYRMKLAAGESRTVYLRLVSVADWDGKPQADSGVFDRRKSETDEFYEHLIGGLNNADGKNVARQAYAGLLWSQQFHLYIVNDQLTWHQPQP